MESDVNAIPTEEVRVFPTTKWSVVIAAKGVGTAEAAAALEKLCVDYTKPLRLHAERYTKGWHPVIEPEEATQEFFLFILTKELFSSANPELGRLRSFLCRSLENFLKSRHRKMKAEKRGGGLEVASLEETMGMDHGESCEAPREYADDRLFDREWAEALYDKSMQRLISIWSARGRALTFDQMKVFLLGENHPAPLATLAEQHGVTLAALKSSIQIFKRDWAEILRDEVEQTVASKAEVGEEIRYLFKVLSE